MIDYTCPHCNYQLKIEEQYAGKKGKCKNCGNMIVAPRHKAREHATHIPITQDKNRSQSGMGKGIAIGCSIALGLFFAGCMGLFTLGNIANTIDKTDKVSKPAPPLSFGTDDSKTTITRNQFNRLQIGMTYEQVVDILGSQGELISENRVMEGTQYATLTQMYSWNAGWAASMNAMFQNNKLVSKSQFGLD